MKNKKDLTDENMTGMPKPDFDINHNPFRDGDSLVDAVRAVLSGQPVTQEQAKELEKENPSALKDKRTQQEEQVNVQEATLVDINFDAGEYKRTRGEKSLKQHKLKIKIEKGKGSWGADKATFTGQDRDLIAYAKKHLGADGRNLKDVQKQLESIEEEMKLKEGYEKTVLNHLAKNKIKGRFEKGKLYVDKKDLKKSKRCFS